MAEINQVIDNEVKSSDVVLFMKGTPDVPMCGFSGRVVQILNHVGVPFKGVNVLESDELRQGIKAYANWPTIPQLYVKGEFVGGCDIITEMFQSGELKQMLTDKGIGWKYAHRHSGERRNPASCLDFPSWAPPFVGATNWRDESEQARQCRAVR